MINKNLVHEFHYQNCILCFIEIHIEIFRFDAIWFSDQIWLKNLNLKLGRCKCIEYNLAPRSLQVQAQLSSPESVEIRSKIHLSITSLKPIKFFPKKMQNFVIFVNVQAFQAKSLVAGKYWAGKLFASKHFGFSI